MSELRVTRSESDEWLLTCLDCGEIRKVQHTLYVTTTGMGPAFGLPVVFNIGLSIQDMIDQHTDMHQ